MSGQAPTFADYLLWAKRIGCTVRIGWKTDASGVPHKEVFIDDSTGNYYVTAVDTKDEDALRVRPESFIVRYTAFVA